MTDLHFLLPTLSCSSVGPESLKLSFHFEGAGVFIRLCLEPSLRQSEVQKEYCGSVESTVARQLGDIKANQNISAASLFKAFTKKQDHIFSAL